MADVFISYASQDRDRARLLAQALGAHGLGVWWDREIGAGQDYGEVIEREIEAAKAVIVLWSKHSVVSRWVRDEADLAERRGTLIPVLIDAAEPPLGLRRTQAVDLSGWNGKPGHEAIGALCRGIRAKMPKADLDVPVPIPPPIPPPRRRWLALGICLALLAAAAVVYGYWDAYHAERVEFYSNVTKRWGLPVGIGPLSAEQVRHRNISLAFVKHHGRRGPVDEIRMVNSEGAYPPELSYLPSESLTRLNPILSLREPLQVVRVRFDRDPAGQVSRQSAFDRNDRLIYELQYARPDLAIYHQVTGHPSQVTESGITHVKFDRPATGPEAGLDKRVLFQGSDGVARSDHDGGYGRLWTAVDKHGRPLEYVLLGADGRPAPNREGVFKRTISYDESGNLLGSALFGSDGRRTTDDLGAAGSRVTYDRYGNTTELFVYGSDGQLTASQFAGVSGRTLAYDDHGNVTESSFFGPDRRLVSNRMGFAKNKLTWSSKRSAIETYFDPAGRPVLLGGRVAGNRVIWDERGRPIEMTGLDENGRVVLDAQGCAKRTFGYDGYGNQSDVACYDGSERLAHDTQGAARTKHVYDERDDKRDNNIETIFFHPDGQMGRYEERYARIRRVFDEKLHSDIIQEAYFDAAGQPVKTREGYATVRVRYGLQGKPVEYVYLDERGEPASYKGRYARKVLAYDSKNNLAEDGVFDGGGKPSVNEYGVFKNKYRYDERGYRIEIAHYDEHDQPVPNEIGCAKSQDKYNNAGQQVEEVCLGVDAAPIIARKSGYSKKRTTYDARGRRLREELFEPTDRPMRGARGYASIEYVYDELGRDTGRVFRDVDGALLSTRVTVDKVEPGTKSQRVGLLAGDVVASYDGREIADTREFWELELVQGERPRQLVVQRAGRRLDLEVTAGRLTGLEVITVASGSGSDKSAAVTPVTGAGQPPGR